MTEPSAESPQILFIEGEMNIYRAAELKDTLLGKLRPAGTLEVDLAGVSELDSAGVQVLLLAKRSAQAIGCTLRLVAHSPAVLEVFELLDLSAQFGDPLVMAPHAADGAA
jgi:anti-sigma B factor antagonist